MRLYREVLIESAEQAEALPVGTVAFAVGPLRGACHAKRALGDWTCDSDDGGLESEDMIGWTALVPIEAEETRSEGTGWIVPTAFGPKLAGTYLGGPDGTPPKRYTQTTWRTPWEEQS